MMFFFKKKEIVVDAFTTNHSAFSNFPIDRSSKFFPDWWKKLPSYNTRDVSGIEIPSSTIRKCDGLIDLYKNGFMLPLWTDLIIETDTTGKWKYISALEMKIVEHARNQYGSSFDEYIHFKLFSPWLIREKTGVNFTYIPPMWNNVNYWNHIHFLPGTVNYKTQSSSHVNVFVNKINQSINLQAGMPLLHIMPNSDKKTIIKCHLVNKQEYDKLDLFLQYTSFNNNQRIFKKMIEKKESESKCPFGFK